MKRNASDSLMCTLNHLRRASRAISHINDAAFSAVDLKSTQFSLLVTLEKCGDIPLSQLAKVLVMERTTLTRNLKPLIAKGLIDSRSESDKRLRIISITKQGKKILESAEPLWRAAQLSLVSKLGNERWSRLIDDLTFLTKEAIKM